MRPKIADADNNNVCSTSFMKLGQTRARDSMKKITDSVDSHTN